MKAVFFTLATSKLFNLFIGLIFLMSCGVRGQSPPDSNRDQSAVASAQSAGNSSQSAPDSNRDETEVDSQMPEGWSQQSTVEIKQSPVDIRPSKNDIEQPEIKIKEPIHKGEPIVAILDEVVKPELAKEKIDISASGLTDTIEKMSEKPVKKAQEYPNHELFNALLTAYVSADGQVNYPGIKADDKLAQYLSELTTFPVQQNWSENAQLAYWLNAYNAFTIKKIVDNYPLSSIMDLANGKVWDEKWIYLGQKTLSLNDIEHQIIRPQFKDARIHFAVNCAAQSCPPLSNKAFTSDNVQSELTRLTRSFINHSEYNLITQQKATISKIFDWYKVDFGDLHAFLNKYSQQKLSENAVIDFKEYNWALNE